MNLLILYYPQQKYIFRKYTEKYDSSKISSEFVKLFIL